MLFLINRRIYSWICDKVVYFAQFKYFSLLFIFFCVVVSIFFAFPPFHVIVFNKYDEYWVPILLQIQSPFNPVVYPSELHAAKRCFRLTVPIIAHYLNFKVWGCILLQYVFGVVSIWINLKLIMRFTNDIIISVLLTISFVFIYVGFGAFYDLRGMFDTISIGFILLAMYLRSPLLVFILTLLSSFTDERGLIASNILWIFFSFRDDKSGEFDIFKLNSCKIALILSWLVYFALRYYLIHKLDFYTATGGVTFKLIVEQMNNMPLAFWSALEGFWVLIVLFFTYSVRTKKYLFSLICLISLLISLTTAMMVGDLTRSAMYIYPFIFVALIYVSKHEPTSDLRKVAYLVLVISFLFPGYYFFGENFTRWCYPLPFRAIHVLNSYLNQ